MEGAWKMRNVRKIQDEHIEGKQQLRKYKYIKSYETCRNTTEHAGTQHISALSNLSKTTHTGEPGLTTQQLSGTRNQVVPAKCPVSVAGRTDSVSILHEGCLVPMSKTSPWGAACKEGQLQQQTIHYINIACRPRSMFKAVYGFRLFHPMKGSVFW